MPSLTESFCPTALIWIAAVEPDLLRSELVLNALQTSLATSCIDNVPYLEDLCMALAKALLATWDTTRGNIEATIRPIAFSESARKPPKVGDRSNDLLLLQAYTLVHAGMPKLSVPKFVWLCGLKEWANISFHTRAVPFAWSPDIQRRYIKVFGEHGFAKSCTYKLSGDLIVHCILRAEHIAAWRVCALAQNENVYGPVAAVHGSIANAVVRQYTDNPPHELLRDQRKAGEHIKFIVAAVSILEITSSPMCRLLIDRDILKRNGTTKPQLALTHECPEKGGVPVFGYIIEKQFYAYQTAMDAVLGFLAKAKECNMDGVDDVHNAMFHPEQLPSTSTLRQYVAE